MLLSIRQYTVLDDLSDYLLGIRELIKDNMYQYTCIMERRCFNLVAHFLPDILDQIVTSNGLLCSIKEIANYYKSRNIFPNILIADDIVIHGRNLARFLYVLEDGVVQVLKDEGVDLDFDQRQALHRRLIDAVDILSYVRSKHPLLLEDGYIRKMQYHHSCSDMEIHDVSLQITDFLSRAGETNTSFVISFRKEILSNLIETDVGDWEYTCFDASGDSRILENSQAPNRKMVSYIRTKRNGIPQNRISTVRYYPDEGKSEWITSLTIFENCSAEMLQDVCVGIEKKLAECDDGYRYPNLRSILKEQALQLREVRWQLVNLFISVADFFDFYEAHEGIDDEKLTERIERLIQQSNWKKISANFRGVGQQGGEDRHIDKELYQFCCDRALQRKVQECLKVVELLQCEDSDEKEVDQECLGMTARQLASRRGMDQEKKAHDLEERPYYFEPEKHNGGAVAFFHFLKELGESETDHGTDVFPLTKGTAAILNLLDSGIVSLKIHSVSDTRGLRTELKVGELATFYWPAQFSVYVPALALLERSCWRQNLEPKEAVCQFLKERAFVHGDQVPKHLEAYGVEGVRKHLLRYTNELYDCGLSYRSWDFDNLEQRSKEEVRQEGIRAIILERAKEFLYLS